MTKWIFMPLFLLFFAGVPVLLAVSQDVPTQNALQLATALVSVSAFGLMLGLFWLSRLMPKNTTNMKFAATVRWHKYIGYAAGLFFLVHPFLMIIRRFWAQESNPVDNLVLMIKSPVMLTGIIAWFLMIVLVVLAFIRKQMKYQTFRIIHGILSLAFVVFGTWHAVRVGRHSTEAMSAFWIALAAAAALALIASYLPKLPAEGRIGELHESA